jgi:hypothetical protein
MVRRLRVCCLLGVSVTVVVMTFARPYFLGFGIPCTAVAFFGSLFVNSAAYSITLPFVGFVFCLCSSTQCCPTARYCVLL